MPQIVSNMKDDHQIICQVSWDFLYNENLSEIKLGRAEIMAREIKG